MQEIMEIASEKELFVIEDSAEALGASIDGVKTFYGNKVITTGEGGRDRNSEEFRELRRERMMEWRRENT